MFSLWLLFIQLTLDHNYSMFRQASKAFAQSITSIPSHESLNREQSERPEAILKLPDLWTPALVAYKKALKATKRYPVFS